MEESRAAQGTVVDRLTSPVVPGQSHVLPYKYKPYLDIQILNVLRSMSPTWQQCNVHDVRLSLGPEQHALQAKRIRLHQSYTPSGVYAELKIWLRILKAIVPSSLILPSFRAESMLGRQGPRWHNEH